jgi:hypothetical protein
MVLATRRQRDGTISKGHSRKGVALWFGGNGPFLAEREMNASLSLSSAWQR